MSYVATKLSNRFPGEVQGKELEAILKNEGVIEAEEENFVDEDEEHHEDDVIQLDQEGEEESQKESDEENAISTIAV